MDALITKDVYNSWIFQDEKKLKWFVDLHHLADENGEIHMSLGDLARRWNTNKMAVSRFLSRLSENPVSVTILLHPVLHLQTCKSSNYQGKCYTECYDNVTHQERSPSSPAPPSLSKEIFLDCDNNAHTHEGFDRDREIGFGERFRSEGLWYETAKVAGIDPHLVVSFFEAFAEESLLTEIVHKDYADYKRHFINYARIKKSKEQQPGKQSNFDTLAQMARDLGL